jgi:phosphohistidine phosphatase
LNHPYIVHPINRFSATAGQRMRAAFPQQAAAIAFRRDGSGLRLCLIRRKGSKRWGIPKGIVEEGDTPEETAVNEAWEEAGLIGRVVGESIGTYEYDKWGGTLTVAVFLMEVLDEEDTWEEDSFRQRRWHALADALSLLADHPVSPLLARARALLAGGGAT